MRGRIFFFNLRMLVFLSQAVVNKYVLNDHHVARTPSDHWGVYALVSPLPVSSSAVYLLHLTSDSRAPVMSLLAHKSSVAANCQKDEVRTSILPAIWLWPTLSICFHTAPQWSPPKEQLPHTHSWPPLLYSCCSFYWPLTSRFLLQGTSQCHFYQVFPELLFLDMDLKGCFFFFLGWGWLRGFLDQQSFEDLMKAMEPSLEKYTYTQN